MHDVHAMLERQAAWQRSRAKLPWEEKLRMALAMRETKRVLRQSADSDGDGDVADEPETAKP